MNTVCTVCRNEILIQIFRGTPYCSVDCRKKAGDDHVPYRELMMVTDDEASIIKAGRNA